LWLSRRVAIGSENVQEPTISLSTYVTQIRINEEKEFIETPLNPYQENFTVLFNNLNNDNSNSHHTFDNIYFSKYKVEPEILGINLQIENPDSIKYWQIELANDTNIIYEQKGTDFSAKLQIDLDTIAHRINSDNLIIQTKLYDRNDNLIKLSNHTPLIIFKSITEKPFNTENNPFSHSYLFAYPNDYSSDWIGVYRQYFEQIRKQNPFNKQIEVLYSQNLSKSEQNEIINQLKTIFQDKRIIKHNDAKFKELPLLLNQINCKYYIIIM
jgi:hypothetical protein